MSSSSIDVALEFVRAICRQDVDALVELMTPEHQFTDSLGNMVKGRENMRQGWKFYFQTVPDYTLTIDETYVNGPAVVMLGNAGGTYAAAGETWKTPAAVRARIEDGKVAEWRVYADNEPLRKLMREQST